MEYKYPNISSNLSRIPLVLTGRMTVPYELRNTSTTSVVGTGSLFLLRNLPLRRR